MQSLSVQLCNFKYMHLNNNPIKIECCCQLTKFSCPCRVSSSLLRGNHYSNFYLWRLIWGIWVHSGFLWSFVIRVAARLHSAFLKIRKGCPLWFWWAEHRLDSGSTDLLGLVSLYSEQSARLYLMILAPCLYKPVVLKLCSLRTLLYS